MIIPVNPAMQWQSDRAPLPVAIVFEYLEQAKHVVALTDVEYLPVGQSKHVEFDVAPTDVEYLPVGQSKHVLVPATL